MAREGEKSVKGKRDKKPENKIKVNKDKREKRKLKET